MTEDGDEPSVRLPEAARLRVIALVADRLGTLKPDEIPPGLRPFARFTPAKRSRLAAGAIGAALEADPVFRQRMASQIAEEQPELAEALETGAELPVVPPADLAAVAYLVRPARWGHYVEQAAAELAAGEERARATSDVAALRRVQEELEAQRTAAKAATDRLETELTAARAEAERLRREVRELKGRARRAEEAAASAADQAAAEQGAARAAQIAGDAERRRLRTRLAEAEAQLDAQKRAVKEGRTVGDMRLWLLLDSVVRGAQGLQRELGLPPVSERPADAVAAAAGAADGPTPALRGLGFDDPALLDELLRLPQVHLVVDGYNVTKLAYGDQPLETQRNRLVTGLGALAAQTQAEVTCVFDGAEQSSHILLTSPRGVRVVFSEPGTTADSLIRRLVRAEPEGRSVVVVSTDNEVVAGVRAAGAHAVPSSALVRRLGRG